MFNKKINKDVIELFGFKCIKESYDKNYNKPIFYYKFTMGLFTFSYELEYLNWYITGSKHSINGGPFDYRNCNEIQLIRIKRDDNQIFSGIIKTKKEFKILLKQLSVL